MRYLGQWFCTCGRPCSTYVPVDGRKVSKAGIGIVSSACSTTTYITSTLYCKHFQAMNGPPCSLWNCPPPAAVIDACVWLVAQIRSQRHLASSCSTVRPLHLIIGAYSKVSPAPQTILTPRLKRIEEERGRGPGKFCRGQPAGKQKSLKAKSGAAAMRARLD